jgi:hypothetical protein
MTKNNGGGARKEAKEDVTKKGGGGSRCTMHDKNEKYKDESRFHGKRG